MPGDPSQAFASMGNYIFNTEVLVDALRALARARARTTSAATSCRSSRNAPRLRVRLRAEPHPRRARQEDRTYWRDVGTLDAYFDANMDPLGPAPLFNLYNPKWPIRSSNYQGPAAQILDGHIERSQIGQGTLVRGGTIRDSVIRREV